jgi:ATP-dependent Clp protease ATP-binding subunit ClpC
VSRILFNKRVTLDLQALLLELNTEEFEERMKAVMNELEMMISFFSLMKFILLLVQVEQPDLWMPLTCLSPLSRGEIQCIGATTLDEYRQYIEKDGALEDVSKDN